MLKLKMYVFVCICMYLYVVLSHPNPRTDPSHGHQALVYMICRLQLHQLLDMALQQSGIQREHTLHSLVLLPHLYTSYLSISTLKVQN